MAKAAAAAWSKVRERLILVRRQPSCLAPWPVMNGDNLGMLVS